MLNAGGNVALLDMFLLLLHHSLPLVAHHQTLSGLLLQQSASRSQWHSLHLSTAVFKAAAASVLDSVELPPHKLRYEKI